MTTFFGHPRGLATLFFTEMWERFGFYGARAILIYFMTARIAQGGLGFSTSQAAIIYGLYLSLVYLLSLPGGWVADNILGQRKAVLYGGIIIALGHFSMTIPRIDTFYLGLALIVLGTGLLKPNISTMVGALYSAHDVRRDAGFSIFYMGINLGAMIAPPLASELYKVAGWRAAFLGTAAIGLLWIPVWIWITSRPAVAAQLDTPGPEGEGEPRPRDEVKAARLMDLAGLIADDVERHRAMQARTLAEADAAAARATAASVVRNAPFAVSMTDRDLKIMQVSQRWREERGMLDVDVIGRSINGLFEGSYVSDIHHRVLAGETLKREAQLTLPTGRRPWLRYEYTPWLEASGEIGGILSNNQLVIWNSLSGVNYQVLATTNLAKPFLPISGLIPGTGSTASFYDPNPASQKFYEIELIP